MKMKEKKKQQIIVLALIVFYIDSKVLASISKRPTTS